MYIENTKFFLDDLPNNIEWKWHERLTPRRRHAWSAKKIYCKTNAQLPYIYSSKIKHSASLFGGPYYDFSISYIWTKKSH